MNLVTLPGAAPCVTPKLARYLARLDRPALEAVAQAAIDQLDDLDGDIDLEPNGDERDGSFGEDDFVNFNVMDLGAGCALADSGMEHRDDEQACCEYGLDQTSPTTEAAAFISVNGMTSAEVEAATSDIPSRNRRRRLTGRLSLAYARGGR